MLALIRTQQLLPVVTIPALSETLPIVDALARGGLGVQEITFRTPCAAEALRQAITERPNLTFGAGTVTTPDDARLAVSCGARFVVSPGFSAAIADVCRAADVPYLPGCATATEVMQACDHEIRTIKFFPAAVAGGIPALRSLAAAFPGTRFVPTGGIGVQDLVSYLSLPSVLACGGSFMLHGTPAEITRRTAEAVALLAAREVS